MLASVLVRPGAVWGGLGRGRTYEGGTTIGGATDDRAAGDAGREEEPAASERAAALRKALTDHGHDLDHFADALGDEGLEEWADELGYGEDGADVEIVCSQDGESDRAAVAGVRAYFEVAEDIPRRIRECVTQLGELLDAYDGKGTMPERFERRQGRRKSY